MCDVSARSGVVFFFFFNDTATTEIYTLSLHDALPICPNPCKNPNGCSILSPKTVASKTIEAVIKVPNRVQNRCFPDQANSRLKDGGVRSTVMGLVNGCLTQGVSVVTAPGHIGDRSWAKSDTNAVLFPFRIGKYATQAIKPRNFNFRHRDRKSTRLTPVTDQSRMPSSA